jgi:hypothetical protein
MELYRPVRLLGGIAHDRKRYAWYPLRLTNPVSPPT